MLFEAIYALNYILVPVFPPPSCCALEHQASDRGGHTIPEQIAKNCKRKAVLIAKEYRGIAQLFWEYLSYKL